MGLSEATSGFRKIQNNIQRSCLWDLMMCRFQGFNVSTVCSLKLAGIDSEMLLEGATEV